MEWINAAVLVGLVVFAVYQKNKTIDWYEKEFSIGLDALLELFLHLPHRIQQRIIAKMPQSVIKKGFKRLSDSI
jgi:hypothetical protein